MVKTAAALGTFDGLHKGHISVLKSALEWDNAICVTFSEPPKVRGNLIMQPHIKERNLKQLGFKRVISLNFLEVKDMAPQEFLKLLQQEFGVTKFCCGFDYRFGKGGTGCAETIKEYCKGTGCEAVIAPPFLLDGEKVSSTKIRGLLAAGEIEKANEYLNFPYCLEMPVVHGDKRGRTLGFPTLNQPLPSGVTLLKFGVYLTETEIDGKRYRGITNIGIRPTFLVDTPLCETYLENFSGEVYGKHLTLRPIKYLRGEQKFASVNELKQAITRDLQLAGIDNK